MAIRITVLENGHAPTIRIEGKLGRTEASELDRTFSELGVGTQISLTGLQLADEQGIDTLLDLERRGARLQNATPYIQALLESAARHRS